jgi:CRISPR-associated protein Cas2
MSDAVHRYILTYDVSSDPRRARLAKTLESYGDRLQFSVFLIDVKPAKMVRLKSIATAQLDRYTDSLLVCDLGPLSGDGLRRIDFIGVSRPITGSGPLVI